MSQLLALLYTSSWSRVSTSHRSDGQSLIPLLNNPFVWILVISWQFCSWYLIDFHHAMYSNKLSKVMDVKTAPCHHTFASNPKTALKPCSQNVIFLSLPFKVLVASSKLTLVSSFSPVCCCFNCRLEDSVTWKCLKTPAVILPAAVVLKLNYYPKGGF